MAASSLIPITLSLKDHARSREAVEQVEAIIARLGMQAATKGLTSLTARVTQRQFQRLFKTKPEETAERPPSQFDFGTSAGFNIDVELQVPDELADFVQSISIQPPATRLTRPAP